MTADHFSRLSPLTFAVAAGWDGACGVNLLLLDRAAKQEGPLLPIEYIHDELVLRAPGSSEAMAMGMARLGTGGEYREARIMISLPHATATLRGLPQEGQVKVAR